MLNRNLAHKTVNLDIIPNLSNLIKSTRLNSELTQNEFSEGINISRRLVGMWESDVRNPSRTTLGQLTDFVEIPKLKLLADSDIFWDEVTKIDVIKNHNEQYVYDLTVDKNHNFIAGDIPLIIHNTSFINVMAFFIKPEARIVTIEDT